MSKFNPAALAIPNPALNTSCENARLGIKSTKDALADDALAVRNLNDAINCVAGCRRYGSKESALTEVSDEVKEVDRGSVNRHMAGFAAVYNAEDAIEVAVPLAALRVAQRQLLGASRITISATELLEDATRRVDRVGRPEYYARPINRPVSRSKSPEQNCSTIGQRVRERSRERSKEREWATSYTRGYVRPYDQDNPTILKQPVSYKGLKPPN